MAARPEIGSRLLAFAVSAYLLTVANFTFWQKAWAGFETRLGFLGFGIAIVALFSGVMLALSSRFIAKPVYAFLILAAVGASYFTDTFGTIIDSNMIDNVLATNSSEGSEFITWPLISRMLTVALLPIFLMFWLRVRHEPQKFRRDGLLALALFLLAGALVGANFHAVRRAIQKDFHALTATFNPSGPISAAIKSASQAFSERGLVRAPVGMDARQVAWPGAPRKPVLLVFVVGESARAMNFSLNGYGRNTNPELAKRDVFNFPHVTSCGTETGVSVPCLFSGYARAEFSKAKAQARETLTDVFLHAGLRTIWWDNDGGAKGAADHTEYRAFDTALDPDLCQEGTCLDDIFLEPLTNLIGSLKGDTVLVLHQRGSHGPAYHLRYPLTFRPFKPDCQVDLQKCSKEEILNAYDNTIAYTDRALARVIDVLARHDQFVASAMVYVSDHGESLGEGGLFFHGTRYDVAPKEQKQVPLVVWTSHAYEQLAGFKRACAKARETGTYSHDNVYHTLLGMMNIETAIYKPELDVFEGCRNG